ncbi:LPS translocon maturation chaperone LptM [Frateuria aurantia]
MSLSHLLRGCAAVLALMSLTACGNMGPLYLPDDPHPPVYVPPKPQPVPAAAGSMSRPAHQAAVDQE